MSIDTVNVGYQHICRDAETHAKSLRRLEGLVEEAIAELTRLPHGVDPTDIALHWRLRQALPNLRRAVVSLEREYMVEAEEEYGCIRSRQA